MKRVKLHFVASEPLTTDKPLGSVSELHLVVKVKGECNYPVPIAVGKDCYIFRPIKGVKDITRDKKLACNYLLDKYVCHDEIFDYKVQDDDLIVQLKSIPSKEGWVMSRLTI